MTDGIRNAKVEATFLGTEDHGIFTWVLTLDYGSSCQGFMGGCFDTPLFDGIPQYEGDKKGKFLGRRGTAYGCEAIRRLLEVLGVDSWERVKGTYVRAEIVGGLVKRLGHITNDLWFDNEAVFEEMAGSR